MTACGTWLCGQVPTMANAQALICRLQRAAGLRPQEAPALLGEAQVIYELFCSEALPEGRETKLLAFQSKPPQTKQPAIAYGRWHYLYSGLSGRRPPAAPHNAKITASWGQFYFLSSDGTLTMGHSHRRSLALPRAEREALIERGKEKLSPKAKTVATLSDLEGLFS